VDFSAIVDSKLGQTQKNLIELFKEINAFVHPEKAIILFDEIDALIEQIQMTYERWEELHRHCLNVWID